jgi:endonuclease G
MNSKVVVLQIFLSISVLVSAQKSHNIENLELPRINQKDNIIKHFGFTLSYNEMYEQANWVAYELTAAETIKNVSRSNNFHEDEAVKSGSAIDSDYKGSGYDRGHLAPAADMSWSQQSMNESFLYSNMSPQQPGFNRGIWKRLEEQVRQWVIDNEAIYVVSGPILKSNLPTIGVNKVAVPAYYFKVLLDYRQPELKGIGFIIPNESSTLTLQSYAVPIDSVENAVGIDFFPALPDDQESKIEKNLCLTCWSWKSTSTRENSSSKTVAVQCSGITKAGNRCKRKTTNESGRCPQHLNN